MSEFIKTTPREYYETISECHKNGNSNLFIEFMLKMIDKTLDEILISAKNESRSISNNVNRLLDILEFDTPLSANEIMDKLGVKSKETLSKSYINPTLKNGI